MTSEPECNDICLYAGDLGLPEYGDVVAYAHPDCPLHGEPMEEDPDENVCGGGDESLRYIREEDVDDVHELQGQGLSLVRLQEGHHPMSEIQGGYIKEGAIDSVTLHSEIDGVSAMVRIKISGCDDATYIEMPMDAAELDVIRRVAKLSHAGNLSDCKPKIRLSIRHRDGATDDDDNFTEVAL